MPPFVDYLTILVTFNLSLFIKNGDGIFGCAFSVVLSISPSFGLLTFFFPHPPTRCQRHAALHIAVDGLTAALTAPPSEMILLLPGALYDRGGIRARSRGLRPLERCDRHDRTGG